LLRRRSRSWPTDGESEIIFYFRILADCNSECWSQWSVTRPKISGWEGVMTFPRWPSKILHQSECHEYSSSKHS
jgi:hypothetical protein